MCSFGALPTSGGGALYNGVIKTIKERNLSRKGHRTRPELFYLLSNSLGHVLHLSNCSRSPPRTPPLPRHATIL